MAFATCLAAGTTAADGDTLDYSEGRLKLIFQVAGAALTGGDTIVIHVNNGTVWIPYQTLTATVPRVEVTGRGVFRAERTGTIATSTGCQYDAVPVS